VLRLHGLLERSTNHVPTFMSEHAQEPGQHTLFMPIESLEVSEEQALGTVRLLQVKTPEAQGADLTMWATLLDELTTNPPRAKSDVLLSF
jgi:hypothetical protein